MSVGLTHIISQRSSERLVARQVFDSDGHSRFSVHASGTSTRGLYTSNGVYSTSRSMEDDVRGNGARDSVDDVGITAQAC